MDKFILKYRKDNEIKLRKIQSCKQKDYWKLLNSLKSHSTKDTPTLEEFLNHFRTINQAYENDDAYVNFELHNSNEFLNSNITRDEILRNINKLKNSKAAGYDSI